MAFDKKLLEAFINSSKTLFNNISKQIIRLGMTLLKRFDLIVVKVKNWYSEFLDWLNEYDDLELHEKFYRAGTSLIILTIFLLLLFSPSTGLDTITSNDQRLGVTASRLKAFYYSIDIIFTWFIVIAYSCGYVLEKLKKLDEAKHNKLIMSLISTGTLFVVFVLSELMIGQYINNHVELDPSKFNTGKVVLKLIFIPYAWLFVAFIYLLLELIYYVIKTILNAIKQHFHLFVLFIIPNNKSEERINEIKDENTESGKSTLKIFITLILFGAILSFPLIPQLQGSKVEKLPKYLFIQSEYFKNSYCKNFVDKDFLVSDIGSGLYSVYDIKSDSFHTVKCEINIEGI